MLRGRSAKGHWFGTARNVTVVTWADRSVFEKRGVCGGF
jgi:hypothetical protein